MSGGAATAPFHGGRILAALGVTQIVSWGILYYGFAPLLAPIEAETGWSRTLVSGAFSAALASSALASLAAGWLLDRGYARAVMSGGSIAAAALLAAASRITRPAELYLVWIGLGTAMAALLYEPAFAVLARWYSRERRRALTLLTLAGGAASLILLPLVATLVERLGWRDALLALAAIELGVTLPLHLFVVRARPEEVGQQPDGRSEESQPHTGNARRSDVTALPILGAAGLLLAATFALGSAASSVVALHLFAFLGERGHAAAAAALTVGLVGLAQIPGRLLLEPLARGRDPRSVTAGIFLLQAAGLALFAAAPGIVGLAGIVVVYGAGNGMATLVRAWRPTELFGADRVGRAGGLFALSSSSARALSPFVAGALWSAGVPYATTFLALAGIAASAALAGWLAETVAARELPHTRRVLSLGNPGSEEEQRR